MNICVYGASSTTIDKSFIEAGELLGEEMAKRNLVFPGTPKKNEKVEIL